MRKLLGAGALLACALFAPRAEAFCGFYVSGSGAQLTNGATEVVLMRDGNRTILSMENNYQGPPENFAMVVPVPVVLQEQNVKTLDKSIFAKINEMGAPRLVEYWEQDPCPTNPPGDAFGWGGLGTTGQGGVGAIGGGPGFGPPTYVHIEAQFTVGEYEIVVLSSNDSNTLDGWLKANGYHIPDGAAPVLEPYIRAGMKFFVAKVNAAKVKFENGHATLSPLRFQYDSTDFALPVRLGLLNSPGTQDLIVNILARERYEVANHPNVTIPTNLEVRESVKANFAQFYNALFDRTVASDSRTVVTEYAWSANSCDPCPDNIIAYQDALSLGGDAISLTNGSAGFGMVMGPSSGFSGMGGLHASLPPREARGPRVRAAAPTVSGSLNTEAIRRVVLRNLNQVKRCHEQGLTQDPTMGGRVSIRFTIGLDGLVTASDVADKDPKIQATIATCIANVIHRLQFASPPDGAPTRVTYPFTLDPPTPGSSKPQGNAGAPVAMKVVDAAAPTIAASFGYDEMVLTRLHLRYDKTTLTDDLVFKSVPAIEGGRGFPSRGLQDLGLPQDSKPTAGINNFQGRYVIRHPWTGPMTCAKPTRGMWGGPPTGADNKPATATGLAFAPRATVGSLGSMLVASGGDGGVLGTTDAGAATADAGRVTSVDAGSAAPSATTAATTSPTPAAPAPEKSGCAGGCTTGTSTRGSWALAGLALSAWWGARRRRDRARNGSL